MGQTKTQTNRDAIATAEKIGRYVANHTAVLRPSGCGGFPARLLNEGAACLHDMPDLTHLGREGRNTVQASVAVAAVRQLWERTCRTVYALHPGFSQRLADSTADAFPWEVLHRLAHPNPLVVFADPPAFTNPDTQAPCRLLGFHVYGRGDQHPVQPTDTGDHDRLGLAIFSEVDIGTPLHDLMCSRVSVPLSGQETVEQALERCMETFVVNAEDSPEGTRQMVLAVLRTALNALLYLCCDDRDEEPITSVPDPARAPQGKGKKGSTPRRMQVVGVGYRIADQFARAQAAYEAQERTPAEGGGKRQPPHMRRMHLRRVRYGPGRAQSKVKLIMPYAAGTGDDEGLARLIPVE